MKTIQSMQIDSAVKPRSIGVTGDLARITMENEAYLRIVYTTDTQQLVMMSVGPGKEVPWETHANATQFICIVTGKGIVDMTDGKLSHETLVNPTDFVAVFPGTRHRIRNADDKEPLKLYTIYSPPQH